MPLKWNPSRTIAPFVVGVGVISLFLGGMLLFLGHRTLGTSGAGLGIVLLLVGGALWRLVPKRRRTEWGAYSTDRTVGVGGLKKSHLRSLAAALIVLAVGAGTFYGTYLAANQAGTASSASVLVTTSRYTQTSAAGTGTATSSHTGTVTAPGSISLVSVTLHAGTATSSDSQGNASMYLVIGNPGSATSISSITLIESSGATPTVFQCSNSTSCSPIANPAVAGSSTTSFTTPSTGFFFSEAVVANTFYRYTIDFANGESITGPVVAKS